MSVAFNLFLNDKISLEKRVLPRFPLNYLTFRMTADIQTPHSTYSVRDISFTGMQLEKKVGSITSSVGDVLTGDISWYGEKCSISAKVVWVKDTRVGVEFTFPQKTKNVITEFLADDRIIHNIKPLHEPQYKIKTPIGLKYWLQTDGPVEFFMWMFKSGEISKFQFIKHKEFFEWDFFKGMRTGEVISIRDKETPLSSEDEFQFKFDQEVNKDLILRSKNLVNIFSKKYFVEDDSRFVLSKLDK